MTSFQIWAGSVPPVTPFIGELSSLPTQTAMIYSSVSRFISAIHKKSSQYYDLESIKAQDSIIINTAITTSEKLSELKDSFKESVSNLVSKVENTYSTINNFKNDINKIIDYTNEFITIESFQLNDCNTNLEKIEETPTLICKCL